VPPCQIALEGVIAAAVHFAHAADTDPLEQRVADEDGVLRRFGISRVRRAGGLVGELERIRVGYGETSAIIARWVSAIGRSLYWRV
jgi:hypothetical protein